MKKDRVLVVGGGIVGICTAYFLVKHGAEVVVIEKEAIGGGCSFGNGGLLVPSHSIPLCSPGMVRKGFSSFFSKYKPFSMKMRFDWDYLSWLWVFYKSCSQSHLQYALPILKDLAEASLQIYRDIEKEEGLDFSLEEKGLLTLYKSSSAFKEAKESVKFLEDQGFSLQVLEKQEVQRYEKNISLVSGGIYSSCDAHMSPYSFVSKVCEFVSKNGGDVYPGTEVVSFVKEGCRIKGVVTTKGVFEFDQLVLSAGVYTTALLKQLGISIPILSAKGYSLSYKPKDKVVSMPLMLEEAKVVVTPFKQELRFSGLLDLGDFSEKLYENRLGNLYRAIKDFIQIDMESVLTAERWYGLRPCTPDGLPIISRVKKIHNLTIAAGHAMLGMTLGPMSGKLAAEIATCQPNTMDVRGLYLDRF